jgi:hypothetical protein
VNSQIFKLFLEIFFLPVWTSKLTLKVASHGLFHKENILCFLYGLFYSTIGKKRYQKEKEKKKKKKGKSFEILRKEKDFFHFTLNAYDEIFFFPFFFFFFSLKTERFSYIFLFLFSQFLIFRVAFLSDCTVSTKYFS